MTTTYCLRASFRVLRKLLANLMAAIILQVTYALLGILHASLRWLHASLKLVSNLHSLPKRPARLEKVFEHAPIPRGQT